MIDLEALVQKLNSKVTGWLEQLVVMLPNLAVAILAVVVGALASRVVQGLVQRGVARLTSNAPVTQLLGNLARICVLAVSIFLALSFLELEKTVASLLAGVGVVGLALGFAFQDIAANFMSGFLMVVQRPFNVGDLVEVAGRRGRVRGMTLRASELETLEGLTVMLPNKDVFQSAIVNYTRTPQRRMELTVGTAYGDDMERVREVVLGALETTPHRDVEHDVQVFFEAFGDSSVNLRAFVWLDRSDEGPYFQARSEAMISIKKAFDRSGITIPFPIRTLDFGAATVGGESLSSVPLRLAEPKPESRSS